MPFKILAFRLVPAVAIAAMVAAAGRAPAGTASQPAARIDIGKVRKFCDLGFRFTKNSIEFDMEKLMGLGLKMDPKVLQALHSEAAVIVAQITNLCRMMAAGWITPERYVDETRWLLQYAIDLQAVRERAEQSSGGGVSQKPDPRLNPRLIAQEELSLKLDPAVELGGDLVLVLHRFGLRYLCPCRPS